MNNENQLVVEDKDTDKDKGKKRDKKDHFFCPALMP